MVTMSEDLKKLHHDLQQLSEAVEEAHKETKRNIEDKLCDLQQYSDLSWTDIQRWLVNFTQKKQRSPHFKKYQHPDDLSLTWGGAGRKPKWLNIELKGGADLEDFLVTEYKTEKNKTPLSAPCSPTIGGGDDVNESLRVGCCENAIAIEENEQIQNPN